MTDEIERWAKFIKDNPNEWKKIQTRFINAQFEKSKAFYNNLKKYPKGKQKIIKIFQIKNIKGYPSLQ